MDYAALPLGLGIEFSQILRRSQNPFNGRFTRESKPLRCKCMNVKDGNGRIHRFLVHHILSKLGFTPPGILFPVSAAMLRDRLAYDQVLEVFSGSIMPFIHYDLDLERGMTVQNDTAHLYRYFDATAQAEYLYRCIEETIQRDLRDEIGFLAVFDAAFRATLNIVDMPNRRASLLVRLILQNKGKLSKGKRDSFSEITDLEIGRIEETVWGIWQGSRQDHASEGR